MDTVTYANEAIVEEEPESSWSGDESLLKFLTDGVTDNVFNVRA